jgi:competence protein ComEA
VKFSGLEKGMLTLTLAAALLCGGYFFLSQGRDGAYTVSGQTLRVVPELEQAAAAAIGEPVNINTATLEQLEALPGIGPVRAQAILDDRQTNGPFDRPEDLIRVPGIGEGTLEELLDYITVG